MAFGPKQIKKPTPTWVKITVVILAVMLGGANTYVNNSQLLTPMAKAESMAVINYLLTCLLVIAPMFGITLPDSKKKP